MFILYQGILIETIAKLEKICYNYRKQYFWRKVRMNRLFFLFSESVKLEAIYLCEDGNYIDKPKLKTGVYPMGTLLSRAIYLLSPWYAEKLNLAKKDEIIALALNTFPNYDSSFSSVVYEDSVAQIVFETLIKNQEYQLTKGRFDESDTKLEGILDYIKELQENTYESTAENLARKLNRLGYIPPKRNLYYTEKQNEKSENNNGSDNESFNPSTVCKNKQFFKLDEPQQVENLYGELELPIYAYEIYDIADLIISSLQCVFEQNYIVEKCQFCNNLFIAKDRRTQYCPQKLKKLKSCQERNKLKTQLIRENSSESQRVRKSIRTQLSNKLGNYDERYYKFLEKSRDYYDNILKGEISETEYIKWMKQYWDDVKAEEKAKKKQSKK